jgi:hypothetical protein
LTTDTVHGGLLRGLVGDCRDEARMLLWMNLVSTNQIELASTCLDDQPTWTIVHGATWRVAAKALADLWYDRADTERTDYMYWYLEYALKYGSKIEAAPDKCEDIERFRVKLESDPRVKAVSRRV